MLLLREKPRVGENPRGTFSTLANLAHCLFAALEGDLVGRPSLDFFAEYVGLVLERELGDGLVLLLELRERLRDAAARAV